MMNETDYAIIIGISRYPSLGLPHPPGHPNNLQGPVLDAKEINDWLAAEDGGGVPEQNRLLVTSDMFPDPFEIEKVAGQDMLQAKPTSDQIAGCFGWLRTRYQELNDLRLGRRLYIYFAGHGFAVDDCDGGVYTANANPGILHHFYVRSWFDWFYRNAYFDEYVLWMDACSDPIPINGTPNEAPLENRQVPGFENGRRVIAYAAKHPLKSVERQMPDGRIRGVFTYTLLQGLKGAATDPVSGHITTTSLCDYLHGNMNSFQTQQDRDNPEIGNEPSFGPVERIDFGAPGLRTFDRVVRFDNRHHGKDALILNGRFQPVMQTIVNAATWFVALPTGIYKLEVGPDLTHIFEVNGESSDDVVIT